MKKLKSISSGVIKQLNKTGNGIVRRIKRSKYTRPTYDDFNTYVVKLQEYFEKNYHNRSIYRSDIELAINKLNINSNPECWKIKEFIQRYANEHNDKIFIKEVKNTISYKAKNAPLEEKIFSWDNIIFYDGRVEINDEHHTVVGVYYISASKWAFNSLKLHFKLKFSDLEIQVVKGKVVFNDEKKFIDVITSVTTSKNPTFIPDLELTPKKQVIQYFKNASNDEIKNYILELKQRYLTYLCAKHKDKFRIRYTIERRVTYESETEYVENAFLFTISEASRYIILVYENAEDSRSSIVFHVRSEQYDQAVNNICNYFTSNECNKRETLAEYYVAFKGSGIIKYQRIYHNDFNSWKKTIDGFAW